MLYVSLAVLAILVFMACASFFPAFQSKGAASAATEKLGVGTGGPGARKILVAYCTRHGSTASIAHAIGEVIGAKGLSVDVRPLRNIAPDTLDGYDAFVLGSGVIWSKLMPNFQDFLQANRAILASKPAALFSVCLTIQRDTEANHKRAKKYIEDSIRQVPEFQPIDKVAFAGAVDMKKLTFFEAFALKCFFLVTPQRGGDHRDMTKVSTWAEKVGNDLISWLTG